MHAIYILDTVTSILTSKWKVTYMSAVKRMKVLLLSTHTRFFWLTCCNHIDMQSILEFRIWIMSVNHQTKPTNLNSYIHRLKQELTHQWMMLWGVVSILYIWLKMMKTQVIYTRVWLFYKLKKRWEPLMDGFKWQDSIRAELKLCLFCNSSVRQQTVSHKHTHTHTHCVGSRNHFSCVLYIGDHLLTYKDHKNLNKPSVYKPV